MGTQHPQDLNLVLLAIKKARDSWKRVLDLKISSLLKNRPNMTEEVAALQAVSCPEVQEEYEKLITIYGTLGQGIEDYLGYLEHLEDTYDRFKKSS